MKRRIFLVGVGIFLAYPLTNPLALFASEVKELPEVVVTATRTEEPKKEVSAFVQVITQEDIKSSTAKNVGDLLTEAGIGHVHKYPGALTARISLRGLTTDLFSQLKGRVLVLINGHLAGTANLAKIPLEDIERIEIVKGPASVIYGSQAMGGAINIITKEGKKEGLHGSLGGEVGSWDYSKGFAELGGRHKDFDYYFTYSRSSANDYDAKGYGRIKNTAYDAETISARLGYRFLNNHHLSFGFQEWRGWKIGSPGARYSPSPKDYSDKNRYGLDLNYKSPLLDQLQYYYIEDKDEWHYPLRGDFSLTKTYTEGANLVKKFTFGEHRLILGAQWDEVEVRSQRKIGAPYNPRAEYNSYGVFGEGQLGLLNKRLLLSAGLRYDYFKNKILSTHGLKVNPRKEDLDHITVRGGLIYKITDKLSFKGNVGTAFRAPAPDEYAADYVSSWGTRYVGNPDLNPEKSTTYDLGLEYLSPLFKGSLSFFHTNFKDKIISYFDNNLGAMTFKNVDGATLQGIELNLLGEIGLKMGLPFSLEPFVNLTYHTRYSSKDELEIQRYGKTLLYIPKWVSSFGIKAGSERWNIRLVGTYNGDEKVQDWAPPYNGRRVVKKQDFTIFNLYGSLKPLKNLELSLSVENLFNRKYEYVQYYPMPERTIIGGLRWNF